MRLPTFSELQNFGISVAHSYQYKEGMRTGIFECSQDTWKNASFERTNEDETISKIKTIFAEALDGYGLITNRSYWLHF
jgi:anthraniloyl-CoA monooxygenase